MKALFDKVSLKCSKLTTRSYSTSFSLGIKALSKKFHNPIYGIYGFVRFADEIVDSFHDYDKAMLLQKFNADTWEAIELGISLNPILNSFQSVVNQYKIERELIETFLHSMEQDLHHSTHNEASLQTYILGSAEVVGLMCLRVFCEGDEEKYQHLKPSAMRLGSAFQKVNFLRDLKADYQELGRSYFPNINLNHFDDSQKKLVEADIRADFDAALLGIRQLPRSSRLGVYTAYVYYRSLFTKIQATPSRKVMQKRIRIPNKRKFSLLLKSVIRYNLNAL